LLGSGAGWRSGIAVVLLGMLLAGAVASAQPGLSSPYGAKKTDEELLRIATHELVHELREAAADELAWRLREATVRDIAYLEGLMKVSTPELRGALLCYSLLTDAYREGLARGELAIDELIQGIYTGETPELRLARAQIAMEALFITRTLGMPMEKLEVLELGEIIPAFPPAFLPRLEEELAVELLRSLMRLMEGEGVELWGYRWSGESEAVRRAAFQLAQHILALFITSKEEEVLLKLHPCEGWLELAEEGKTTESRWFASSIYLDQCVPSELDLLRELAIAGGGFELRFLAARLYLLHYFSYRFSGQYYLGSQQMIDWLTELAVRGESEELRAIASRFLTWPLQVACTGVRLTVHFHTREFGLFSFTIRPEGEIPPESLYELALEGERAHLRWAAGWALGWCWRHKLFVRELEIADIPRRSKAEAHTLEQALIIFATENTIAYPELAQAAVLPLEFIWGEGD